MKFKLSGALTAFDEGAITAVKRLPESVRPIMTGASLVGSPPVGLAALGVGLVDLIFLGAFRPAAAIILVFLGAGVVDFIKRLVHRTRPDTVYVATVRPRGHSFPSGHSADAVLVYGLLAYGAVRYLLPEWAAAAAAVCAAFAALVGISRVWLGAHFPSDVLGGWLIGGAWLIMTLVITRP